MSRIVYLNGKYYKESEAKISIFDRGLLFADSVYEVTAVIDNKRSPIDELEALESSAASISIIESLKKGQRININKFGKLPND